MDGFVPDRRIWSAPCPQFGPSRYLRDDPACEVRELPRRRRAARQLVRTQVPSAPGVYGLVDGTGDLIYVGMSARLQQRLLTYFTSSRRGTKERRLAGRAVRLAWEVHAHGLIAQLRELELIRTWRPQLNVQGRPGRHELGYLYLTAGPAPTLRAGRRVPAACLQCWGPLPMTYQVLAAVNQVNHVFRLRDCPDRTPIRYAERRGRRSPGEAAACLRGELGSCLAPCCGGCRQQDYARSVTAARAWLDGDDGALAASYESAMRTAAGERQFERAAQCRDTWLSLVLLQEQLARVRRAVRELWGVYPVRANGTAPAWVLLTGGRVSAVAAAPRSLTTARRCLALLDETFDRRRPAPADDYDHIRLVAAWFRRHPDEQAKVLAPEQARALCSQKLTRANRAGRTVPPDPVRRSA